MRTQFLFIVMILLLAAPVRCVGAQARRVSRETAAATERQRDEHGEDSLDKTDPHRQAQSPASVASRYNQAGALYRDGRFLESLEQYEQLMREGIANPDLYYNAANAAYRCNLIGRAVLYLERALRLDPSDPDALANLTYINEVKQDKEPSNDNPVVAFLARHYSAININTAALWSGVSFAFALLCATGILFTFGWKRLATAIAVFLSAMLFLLSTATLIEKVHTRNTVVEAVIMADAVRAYSGPGEENTHIFTVHEGTKVVIERKQDSWNLVRLKSGAGGWIQADTLEHIW